MNAVTSHVAVCGKTAENFQITLNIVLMKLTTKRSTSVTSFNSFSYPNVLQLYWACLWETKLSSKILKTLSGLSLNI